MQQIERGILFEERYLGVTVGGLVFPQGTIMIDAPLRLEDVRLWQSMLLNQRRGSNRLLVLLDSHPDRSLGARAMESTILAHQAAGEVFRDRPMIFKGLDAGSGAVWETYNESIGMRWTVPDITFSDRMTLHWGGPEVVIEHHPGPSVGAIWVIVPELKIMFVGDMVVLEQPVFLADADLDAWLEALEVLKSTYMDYQIICGRGGLADIAAIRAQIRYLKRIVRGLGKLADKGAAPNGTSKMIAPLLRTLSYSQEWHDLYAQRLRHGLYQYYSEHYSPAAAQTQSPDGDGD